MLDREPTRGKPVKGAGKDFRFPARLDADHLNGTAMSMIDLPRRDP